VEYKRDGVPLLCQSSVSKREIVMLWSLNIALTDCRPTQSDSRIDLRGQVVGGALPGSGAEPPEAKLLCGVSLQPEQKTKHSVKEVGRVHSFRLWAVLESRSRVAVWYRFGGAL